VLPQFPAGTEVALVRQMMLFDNQGRLASTAITESIQIRVYRAIALKDRVNTESASSLAEAVKNSGQDFYQIRLSRLQLFANKAGGLRATGPEEKEFAMCNSFGADEGKPNQYLSINQYELVLQSCFTCHRGAGINSLNSRSALLKPNWLQHDSPAGAYAPDQEWWVYGDDTGWKQRRYEWGLLNGYWKSGNSSH
jgi:hypothetical protein